MTPVSYAQTGSGKQAVAIPILPWVSVKEDARYEEEFIPIGKAYGGYTDQEWKQLSKAIRVVY